MSENNAVCCPLCRRELHGSLILVIVETDEAQSETLYESPGRNWMKCEDCRLVLCKDCGVSADESYCHPCRERSDIRRMPEDLTHRVKLTVRSEEIGSAEMIAVEEAAFQN